MAEEQLKTLKRTRGSIRAKITNFSNYLGKLQDQLEKDPSTITEVVIKQLQLRIDVFGNTIHEFNEIQNQIDSLVTDEHVSLQEVEREAIETLFYSAMAAGQMFLSKNSQNQNANNSVHSSNAGNSNIGNIKLPTINLPTFSGAYDQWISFRDTFESLINNNTSLSTIQKFYYLKSALTHDALQVIQSLDISIANYDVAWNLLKERFENERIIVQGHVKALFELPSIQRESAFKLRQLCDGTFKHLRALKAVINPDNMLDAILVHLISTKLDSTTQREWGESTSGTSKIATIDEFTTFLSNRSQLLETLESNKNFQTRQVQSHQQPHKHHVNAHSATFNKPFCHYCRDQHYIYKCPTFLSLTVANRLSEIKRLKLCMNCLYSNHFYKDCTASNCKKCAQKHNTLLHKERESSPPPKNSIHSEQAVSTCVTETASFKPGIVILSTAEVMILDDQGRGHKARVLLDSGSQAHFITKRLCNELKLNCCKANIPVSGIAQQLMSIGEQTEIKIKSKFNNFTTTLNCLVLPKIIEKTPHMYIDIRSLNIPHTITLSDSLFNEPHSIDLLIGADLFYSLLCIGQIKLGNNQPILQKTKLGWIISGSTLGTPQVQTAMLCASTSLETKLEKFWRIEEVDTDKDQIKFSQEEKQCEQHFIDTISCGNDGHYIVNLPLRDNVKNLGESRPEALRRLLAMERKFEKNPKLKTEYVKFMHEYEAMGHMALVENEDQGEVSFYLPHHAVIKETSETTKLRVVFDGSSKTSSGLSLNETMLVGPTIQDDVLSIVIRFRTHTYVLIADVGKMYRQVYVQENQQDLQRILWRNNSNQEVKCFKLKTITYGTSAAPFQAIRSLQQAAKEHHMLHTRASKVIHKDFYVDDLMTGAETREEVVQLAADLKTVLGSRGFELRKWGSNDNSIIKEITETTPELELVISENKEKRALGLLWNSHTDTFRYDVNINTNTKRITKRSILSTVSQIFDPLGLIGPTTIKAKILLQELWHLKLKWDQPVPDHVQTLWQQYNSQLYLLNEIRIPRHVTCSSPTKLQLHGFADASEAAYGACIYIRSENKKGIYIQLVAAKSRVAPLKSITLPRLELCAALLLAQLSKKVTESANMKFDNKFYWSDSSITLSWLNREPNHWKTFIGNRVAEIQNLTSDGQWRHVSSADNPADIISRGTTADQLLTNNLWWNGPTWLTTEDWPTYNVPTEDTMLERKHVITMLTVTKELPILTKFSNFSKLQRIIAYCLRWRRFKRHAKPSGVFKPSELNDATRRIVFMLQEQHFNQERQDLKSKGIVNTKSKLANLNPFLDEQEMIRVGGRLRNSNLSIEHKNPYVLPERHHVVELLVTQEHIRLLHCSHEQLLATLRQTYWIMSGRQVVKRITRKCLQCFKTRPRTLKYIMGDLPSERVIGSHRPFVTTGVDYAGPLQVREGRRRGKPIITKGYICVFVCFNTKAVHLELVSDLTSECFLAALRRFVARRGMCNKLFSDNGTNFRGANSQLKEIYEFIQRNEDHLRSNLASQRIDWHFIPPRAPHFGGLWEAAVKSAKLHLMRVTKGLILTFEQYNTLLTEIESVLNSRPITPISSCPNDLTALTPAHFLIGDMLVQPAEMSYIDTPPSRLSHWQHIQRVKQHFWQRWHREYLHQLQVRCKWHQPHPNIKIGDLVLLMEDDLPPLKWITGRVITTHPGEDKIVRVVKVQTASGVFKRPVRKLCALPINDNDY